MENILKKKNGGGYALILKPKYDRGELAKEILRGLAMGGILAMSLAAPNLAQLLKFFETADRVKVKKVINSLKHKKLIDVYEKDGQDFVEITKAGETRLLQYNIDDMVLKTTKRWDGRWRVVLFDVPEKFGLARRAMKDKLADLGFYQYQKSVYVTPHRCRDEIEFVANFFEVGRFVKYLETDELDDEIILIDHFELDQ